MLLSNGRAELSNTGLQRKLNVDKRSTREIPSTGIEFDRKLHKFDKLKDALSRRPNRPDDG